MENKQTTTLAKDKNEFVSCIITNEDGNVLVLKRRNDVKLDPGKYDFCSGHMKEGEVPMQTMYRELNEEIGIRPEHILFKVKLGDIETPHKKLKNTITHLYHVEIGLSEEEINEMIKNVEVPEMQKARYVKDIDFIKRIFKETEIFRSEYTKEMIAILDMLTKEIDERKEKEKEICQEK